MKLFNTLTHAVEDFTPQNPPHVTFYSCGPTVYSYVHIGNLRTYVNNDILRRSLAFLGYDVKHVMNITDVGHLSGDDDSGEDKLEKGARMQGKSVVEISNFYSQYFVDSIDALNILHPHELPKATDHIPDMISLIKKLQDKGYAYETDEALYFDISKCQNYGVLKNQKIEEEKQQSREGVHIDPNKKNQADFALWFKRKGRFQNHIMHWDSPWGDGFPGWHIECSAMSMKYLGIPIDIHAGGVDLAPVHHENEIAQSECAFDSTFVKYWFHSEFLMVDGEKMSKSKNNLYTIDDIKKRGIHPLSLRYLYLQTHYRQMLNFTWDALVNAQNAYFKLKNAVDRAKKQTQRHNLSEDKLKKSNDMLAEFSSFIGNDLQTSQMLALMWKVIKSNIPSEDKLDLIYTLDEVMGLKLRESEELSIPYEITQLAEKRKAAREKGDFKQADDIRLEIQKKGYAVNDVDNGYTIIKTSQSSLDF